MIKIKIGIISDTHISKDIDKLKAIIDKHFKEIELIIHAGDYKNKKVIEVLRKRGDFIGVWGNNDNDSIKELVNEKEIVKLKGYKIGIYHGHEGSKSTLDAAYNIFRDDDVDIIIFGHSHQPIIKTKNKVLMLNPGSITSKRKERWFSLIVLELERDSVNAELKFFNKT